MRRAVIQGNRVRFQRQVRKNQHPVFDDAWPATEYPLRVMAWIAAWVWETKGIICHSTTELFASAIRLAATDITTRCIRFIMTGSATLKATVSRLQALAGKRLRNALRI